METKLIAMILGVTLVLATRTTLGTSLPQAKALYPKQQFEVGVANSGVGGAAGHTKQLTTIPTGGMGHTKPPTVTHTQTQPGKVSGVIQFQGIGNHNADGKIRDTGQIWTPHQQGPGVTGTGNLAFLTNTNTFYKDVIDKAGNTVT